MKKAKRYLIFPLLSISLLASCGGGSGSGGDSKPSARRISFKNVYDEMVGESTLAEWALILGSDLSYLKFDSNPFNVKGGTSSYIDVCHTCTLKCGFPEATWTLMLQTRALDGTQTDSSNGVKATWTYHPDAGLVCTFTYIS